MSVKSYLIDSEDVDEIVTALHTLALSYERRMIRAEFDEDNTTCTQWEARATSARFLAESLLADRDKPERRAVKSWRNAKIHPAI